MSLCAVCGGAFSCGMVDSMASEVSVVSCWCMDLPGPSLTELPEAALSTENCLCPACLRNVRTPQHGPATDGNHQ